jgi:hypothetical protein
MAKKSQNREIARLSSLGLPTKWFSTSRSQGEATGTNAAQQAVTSALKYT